MRNLKRALSLTLASVMLLGMMVVGSSAAGFPDVDDTKNVEAIEVLQAVAVMVGDKDTGNFRPDAPVSRAEMAVIMSNLLGLTTSYYVSTCPFEDVSGSYSWARGPVGAAYASKVLSGRTATTFDPAATVTAVEAASMIMRGLGYFQHTGDFADGFNVATVRQANLIGLFSGIKGDATTPLTRNQVAQMALNALQANIVDFTGTPGIKFDGVEVGYKAEYTPRTSPDGKYAAIGKLVSNIGTTDQYYVQLGEELYDGDLRLDDTTDAFGAPARRWSYKSEEIGTYAKNELLHKEYSTKVTGRDLYDLLGANVIKAWDIYVAIDGETDPTVNGLMFDDSDMTRNNNNSVGGTEKGVLTQVYMDTTNKEVYIVVINTYLAKATEDYDAKNEEVDLDIFALATTSKHTSRNPDYIKNAIARTKDGYVYSTSVTVEDEDIDVSGVKDGDKFLVTVADGKVQTMVAPEVVADVSIDSFKYNKDVTVEGKTYEYANTAKYDDEVLEQYSNTNLKDTTFNVILDKYGYLIGIEQNQDPDQYVFLAGIDGKYSPLSTRTADANIIHLDGTMETVSVNFAKSSPVVDRAGDPEHEEGGDWTDGDTRDFSQINTWCTYGVDSKGVYTLKEVLPEFPAKGTKVAQAIQDANGGDIKIDKKNVSLDNAAGDGKVYGNDKTVYINVETKAVKTTNGAGGYYLIIDDVDSVTTGTKNVSLTIADQNKDSASGADKDNAKSAPGEVYTLYKDNGYIIAAVTIGEDDGASKTYAYIHSDDVKRETYNKADDEWTWVREAIVDGKVVDLREVGDGTALSVLDDEMLQNNWYELKLNADGNVKSATLIKRDAASGAAPTNPPHSDTTADAKLAKDYVFCYDYTNHISSGEYPKFVGLEEMVDDAIADNDTVILFRNGFTAGDEDTITYKDGTLYVNDDDVKGFDVSPEVKTVLCLSDGEGNAFDDVDDSFTGYAGLERAIRNLDSNFTGDLSVVFEKGSAVVIIFNDTTDVEDDGDGEVGGPAKIVGNDEIDVTDPTAPELEVYVYGGATVANSAVKKYLETTFGGTATQKNGLWSFGVEDDSYEGVKITQTQVWKVAMYSTTPKDGAGTDVALISTPVITGATVKNGSDYYVKASGTVDFDVKVGTLTTATTLTFTVTDTSATLAATTKNLVVATDRDTTVPVTSGALTAITKDITLKVTVTDT